MNSVPNSDSKQCTESKLGWVHQVHTLAYPARTGRAHCAHAGPCLDRVVAYKVPYHRPNIGHVASPLGHIVAVSLRACTSPCSGSILQIQLMWWIGERLLLTLMGPLRRDQCVSWIAEIKNCDARSCS